MASESQGVLSKVAVRRGDIVKSGQLIAMLESGVEEAMLRAANLKAKTDAPIVAKLAEVAAAEKKLARQQNLATRNVASQQTLEQAETDVAVLKGQLKQTMLDRDLSVIEAERMKAVLERRVMRSPVDGVVEAVDHYAGEYADPSSPIVTLAEVKTLRIEVYLPLSAYPLVNVGMNATVYPVGPVTGSFPAQVTTKDRQIDAASNLFQVQLTLNNSDLASLPACAVRLISRIEASFLASPT
jgi:RND family efflux transporter MFP subunit